MKDIGDLCIECGEDTAFGSGLYVNRIPADDGKQIGYLCPECQSIECDACQEKTLEYFTGSDGGWYCESCLDRTHK